MLLNDLVFPEGPRWHNGRLWFSDMLAHEVVAVDLGGRRETIVAVPEQPSGLGWLPDGRLLVVSMVDRKLLRLDPDGLAVAADLVNLAPHHCNDMVVDAQGRAYIGNFGFDLWNEEARGTALIMVTPEGHAGVVAEDMWFPNGMAITPDGRTLIVAETVAHRLTAFDTAEDGSLSHRRVWAQVDARPDGICLDAEGCVWMASPREPRAFLRIAEGGEVLDRIDLADRSAYACALGGVDRRTLFLLEAFASRPADGTGGRSNGRIRMVEVEVPGVGLP